MKKQMIGKLFGTVILLLVMSICPRQADGQVLDIIWGLGKRVIKAVDLQIQRLQNNTIDLQNAQQALQNLLSKLKLEEITDWATRQRDLYQSFYTELKQVKTIITYYQRVKSIVEKQIQIVNEYKRAYALFKKDGHFTADEISTMANIYNGILSESIRNLEAIQLAISSFAAQMSDSRRLEMLEAAADKVDGNLVDLRRFNNNNVILSLQRAKDEMEVDQVRKYYGLQ